MMQVDNPIQAKSRVILLNLPLSVRDIFSTSAIMQKGNFTTIVRRVAT